MKAKIRFNPTAFSDLNEIKEYISQDNETFGAKVVNKILEDLEGLSQFPEKGKSLTVKLEIKTKYRYLISGEYIIFYTYENEIISIQRILHGKRDYLKILFKI